MAARDAAGETRVFLGKVREVLQQLAVLFRNTHFHDLSNEVFREPLQRFVSGLRPVLQGEGELELLRREQELYANGVRLRMELSTVTSYKLVSDELEKHGLGGIKVEGGVNESDVRQFLSLFAPLAIEEGAELLNRQLGERGIESIVALAPREEAAIGVGDEASGLRERALRTYQEALDFIRRSMDELESPAQLNQRRAKRVIHKLVDLSYEEGEAFSLFGLASVKDHDHYTFNHMVNVCVLAIAFGQRLGLPRAELAELGLAALYHDLGKLDVPAEILNKPGKLSAEEWATMGDHTVFGARSLFSLVAQDPRLARRILAVLQHHHGYDGNGYPDLKLLTRQSLYARIVAVVDLYDAMTTKRVYQEEFLPDAALRRMHELAGSYCDPLLAKAFTNCMGIFPVGSTVELESGELAVVVEPNPDPRQLERPRIRVVSDRNKIRVEPQLIDVSRAGEVRQIRRCVDPELYGINAAHYAI